MARALALGFLVGLPIAASPGPMFFLTLRRTLARGWRSGLYGGLGIATGDAVYAGLAAFGVTAITNLLVGQRRWIGLAGGIAIMVIGARIVRAQPEAAAASRADGRPAAAYLSMVALTLSNPPTILSFTAIFAGLGLHVSSGWGPALALVAGVLLGSAAWWIAMTGAATLLRERLTPAVTRGIAIASGLVLIGFGVATATVALTLPNS
jgi:threonine/homoserine/homoserine lactone efflux protein